MTKALEYEIEFSERPGSDVVVLDLEFSEGVSFHFQPALTQEEIDEGASRPENVVGSYAVYYNRAGRVVNRDGVELENYETGKVAHLYRPFVRDANGDQVWCEQVVDAEAGTLTIAMPKAWLDSAAYPVVLGPTFGYTSIGASGVAGTKNYVIVYGPYAPASNGNITSVSIYNAASSPTSVTLGIYDDDSGRANNLLADDAGGSGAAPGWTTHTLDSSPAVTSGTDYHFGCNASVNLTTQYDSVSGFKREYKASEYSDGVLIDPFVYQGGNANRTHSVYGTYTESGGFAGRSTIIGGGIIAA